MDLNLRAAARLLGLTEDEVFRLVEADQLPHRMVQDQPRFNRVDLLEYATRHQLRLATDLFEDERAGALALRLSGLLEAGGIRRDVPGGTPAALLGALVRTLQLPGVDPELVTSMVEARRGLDAIGHGIAIPHSRTPVAVAPHGPLLALAFPAEPLACDAPDGQPVRAVFFIVSPSIRVHLDVLSKLGAALHDAELRGLLGRQAPDHELLARLRHLEAESALQGRA